MKHLWALLTLLTLPVHATDLTLKWTAPTTYTDKTAIGSAAITYNVYGAAQGSPLVLLTPGLTTASNIRTNVNPGTICYAVTAVIASQESAQTIPVCTTVSPSAPNSPGGLTITLVTTSTIAYGLAPAHDRLAFLIIGSVPLGTTCLPDQTANTYRAVPTASVTYNPPYKPTTVTTVFATCSG
jgi:hypothetical protein